MGDQGQKQLNFVQNVLPKLILKRNDDLKNHQIVSSSAECSTTLDGFMSAIFQLKLVLESETGK